MKELREENYVSRKSHLALYYQIQQNLEQEILSGKYKPGEKLPSENELTERFKVSRMTLRRAMDQLVSNGLLQRIQGRGTFVVDHLPKPKTVGLTRWSFKSVLKEGSVHSKLQNVEEIYPSLRVANALHTMPGETVLQFTRLLYLENQLIGYAIDNIPKMIVWNIDDWNLGDSSLLVFLAKSSNLEFGKAVERVRAIVAEEDGVEILGVEPGSPLLYVDSLVFLVPEIPVILTSKMYREGFVYSGMLSPLIEDNNGHIPLRNK